MKNVIITLGDSMKVKGKKIILTGAGSGMGKEMAIQLLHKGATVIALDISQENLEKLKNENKSGQLFTYVLDISNQDSILKFKEDYFKTYGVVDGLINNAGIIQPFVHINELGDSIIHRVMDVNFYGPVNLTKAFLPELLKRPEAHIVNTSSMGGFFPFPGQTIYGASKAALKLFTEGLYSELLDTNVHVTVVFPGAIATDITKNSNVNIGGAEASTSTGMAMSASKAAHIIIRGMEKNKFKIYVGKDSKFMSFLYKVNSKGAIKFINKMMKKMNIN